jgi:hypothetical protein
MYEILIGLSNRIQILMRSCSLDEGFKSSSYLTETLLDPELGHAYESNKTAFNKAYNVKEDMWAWSVAPENKWRMARFAGAMNGAKNMTPPEAISEGSSHTAWYLHGIVSPLTSNWQGTDGDSSLRDH